MIIEKREDLFSFDGKVDALVNTVNCVGVMGNWVALQFKKRYPESFWPYRVACVRGDLRPGHPMYMPATSSTPGIIHFPTKRDWRDTSQIDLIEAGLYRVRENYEAWRVKKIAMPKLGCGAGGLDWFDVRPLIHRVLGDEPLEVIVALGWR